VALLVLLAAPAMGAEGDALSPAQQARYEALLPELRCVVCQNESLAESQAPLAGDLRRQIRIQLAQGHSDAEIKNYLTARYGEFVLYRPPLETSTALLWFGPLLFALIAAAVIVRYVRRAARLQASANGGERD
jgi:cytochrome c-type biogenesis protein CcmH